MLKDFDYVQNGNEITLLEYLGKERIVVIPTEATRISDNVFAKSNPFVKEIYIHKNIIEIGCAAIMGLCNLEKIVIDEENKYYSTMNCNVIFELKTKRIIGGCSYSKIPAETVEIWPQAFYQARLLQEVNFPVGLKSIDHDAFYNCHSLKEIYLPKTVTSISDNAFEACWGLEKIVVDIENPSYASFNCNCIVGLPSMELITGCKNTIIPEGTRKIGYCSFSEIPGIKHIALPSTVEYIDMYAFQHCIDLEDIYLPDAVCFLDNGAFAYCEKLKTVHLSDQIQLIPNDCFRACISLKEINIPKNIVTVCKDAFRDSSLEALGVELTNKYHN